MSIGIIIIVTIMLIKYQPVYAVTIDGEKVGYVKNKVEFENLVNEQLCENQEENIAFADIEQTPEFQLKLLDKTIETTEEQVLATIKENADVTYYRYAITVNGEAKEYVNSMQEAEEVIAKVKEETASEVELGIVKEYNKENQTTAEIQLAEVSDTIESSVYEIVQEQAKKEASTVNGVYLATTPVKGLITSRYGNRESIRSHSHQGLDIAAKTGTSIKAVADGTVKFSGTKGAYGNLIIIDHGNGVETYYGHCSKLYAKTGAAITAGDVIAAVGSTGNSTGSHLHFEIHSNGTILNPQKYLYK